MSTSDFISIMAILGSLLSLYVTQQNKKKIQQNEFNFSKRKVWFEKQNEVIDKSIEKIIDIHELTGDLITLAELKESGVSTPENKICAELQKRKAELIINNKYLNSHRHYFSQNMEKNVDLILKSSTEIYVQLHERSNNNKINKIEIEQLRNTLAEIPTHFKKIIKEIKEEHLNL